MNVTKIFGCKVFDDAVMRARLPKSVYESLKRTRKEGTPLDENVAHVVAGAMKDWAVEMGATHYTHWFQPMTNITAGKHDAFLTPTDDGRVILEFSGKSLVKGEPDASSFPSGGLRATFEARGYTAWDPTSPAFVKDGTLYIPTAFCSYTGEALDTKTPLLQSMDVVSDKAIAVLRLLGVSDVKRVMATVGAEQEYFLIDRALYERRLDLKLCGRTLFGARPPKGQELDDHYFGRIRLRVSKYMHDLDEELWSLGVTSKTKHNEVAPAQHELAPVFESANVACDHNQLIMETCKTVAKKNGLACLLHEKPFHYINGSGKHNNWSLSTDTGKNLLSPGKNPGENDVFLVFLSAVLEAVDEYGDLLRLSAASAGNDHRLGGFEAPPAIVSVFLGEQLTTMLQSIASGVNPDTVSRLVLHTAAAALPDLPQDDSDRNRTSPFAFTGNKFEFRMVGASQSIAYANIFLNTAVADVLDRYAQRLQSASDIHEEVRRIVHDVVADHSRIIYNGNNYTEEWVERAKKRGLPVLNTTCDAIPALISDKNVALFERHHIFSRAECFSRHDIMLENYIHVLSIEATTMVDMARRSILPACIRFAAEMAKDASLIKEAGGMPAPVSDIVRDLSSLIGKIKAGISALEELNANAGEEKSLYQTARYYCDMVVPAMNQLRECCDRAETMVAEDAWPLPTYTDLIYRV